ncbi:MAG: hypothetical protein J2P29_14125, partial [Actinobacteria bacterium]|nr:hypothetical protein [Actinomycetota bacterium]
CWAVALVGGRAWTWAVPGAARIAFGALLLTAVLVLLAAATSRQSYQRTRLALVAGPVIIALDATAVAVTLTVAPGLTYAVLVAIAVSVSRIGVTTQALRGLAVC